MTALRDNEESGYSLRRLTRLQRKLKAKEKALFKRTFREGLKARELELMPLYDELSQLFSRSYPVKINRVVECARNLIDQHLQENPRAIVAITEKVLKNIAEHADVEIALNPTDAALLGNSLSEIPIAQSGRNFVIVSDETIKRGSLVLKANKSIIDAHLSTQLGRALSILLT